MDSGEGPYPLEAGHGRGSASAAGTGLDLAPRQWSDTLAECSALSAGQEPLSVNSALALCHGHSWLARSGHRRGITDLAVRSEFPPSNI